MAHDVLPAAAGRNRNVGAILLLLAVGMVGMAYAAVPLYYAFCAATGYGGTTRVAPGNAKGIIARPITVASTPTSMPACHGASRRQSL